MDPFRFSIKRLLCLAFLLLLIAGLWPPPSPFDMGKSGSGELFEWQRHDFFRKLEADFLKARDLPPEEVVENYRHLKARAASLVDELSSVKDPSPHLFALEETIFKMAALAAAGEGDIGDFQKFIFFAKSTVKSRLKGAGPDLINLIYRIMYGGRSAVEEVAVQLGIDALPPLADYVAPRRAIPSAVVHGVEVQSGDIALSRGGAPTSALIARSSDYPGNFSHASLIHVDEQSNEVSVIESLIEKGTVITPLEDFLEEKMFRILLLRLDPSLTEQDRELPHRAATRMLGRIDEKDLKYDFAMDWEDEGKFFCSEVPYHAYRSEGINLWEIKSRISSRGVDKWLLGLGVENFTTLFPSTLEYDWKVLPVAQWRNLDSLLDDRLDNATLDALLEGARSGLELDFPYWKLPLARTLKGVSIVASFLGFEPPVPIDMTAQQMLRVDTLNSVFYPKVRERLGVMARAWEIEKGYSPPYWRLYDMALKAVEVELGVVFQ